MLLLLVAGKFVNFSREIFVESKGEMEVDVDVDVE